MWKAASGVFRRASTGWLVVLTVAVAGCGKTDDSKIVVYRIPKEQPPSTEPAVAGDTSDTTTAVHWTAPSGWEEQPASGFRKGSFLVRGADGKTADVSVISFPEAAGGVLANVNRWRNQLKLQPIANETEIGAPFAVAGRDMFVVDLVSEEPIADGAKSRLLGGIFPLPGETWFFKMVGPDELVRSQEESFRQFLSSVHLEQGAAQPISEASPASGPMSANTGGNKTDVPMVAAGSASAPSLQYQLPNGWEEKPLSPMRLASFKSVAPGGKETDISVVSLPGTAGGNLANVNRWRGQLNLQPIDEEALGKTAEHLQANNHEYLLVNLESEGPVNGQPDKQRILAAITCEANRCWFIKMTGETAAVESQQAAFKDFLQSLKLP